MRLAILGEGLIEARADGALAYGGDVVNTAVYLARQGARPELVTAMGCDGRCETIVAAWAEEGIGVGQVLRDPQRTAGLYRIALNAAGERTFAYDRDRSAARGFFEHAGASEALAWAAEADVLYLTGITLSIFAAEGRARIVALAETVRARGGQVAFDPNYRPAGWPSPEACWAAIEALGPHLTLALPSIEDHVRLKGPATPAEAAAAWLALGPDEVVVKLGEAGAYAATRREAARIPAAPARALDTTAAGDAFNAGYIAARLLAGQPMAAAARHAAALAAEVVAWPGAIAPRPVGLRPPTGTGA